MATILYLITGDLKKSVLLGVVADIVIAVSLVYYSR